MQLIQLRKELKKKIVLLGSATPVQRCQTRSQGFFLITWEEMGGAWEGRGMGMGMGGKKRWERGCSALLANWELFI